MLFAFGPQLRRLLAGGKPSTAKATIGVLAVAVIAVAVILVRKVLLQKDEEDSGDDEE